MHPPGTPWGAAAPDTGALAMQTAASLGEVSTIATAQLLGGLSGLLVSEGLAKLIREMMGGISPAPPEPVTEETEKPADSPDAASMSASALRNMVMQGAVGRILALNTVNTYLSLATSEQLRRIGTQLVRDVEEPAHPPAPDPAEPPASQPPVWTQAAWQQPAIGAHPYPQAAWRPACLTAQPPVWFPYRHLGL